MDLRDEIVTKDDKKHAKREAKACLKHKHYWVNKEEDIIFNGKKAVYKVLNNQDKVTMKHFYHIRCNPKLEQGFCDMRRISQNLRLNWDHILYDKSVSLSLYPDYS